MSEKAKKRAASIATKVRMMQNPLGIELYHHPIINPQTKAVEATRTGVYWRDIRALAAFCLSQIEGKPKAPSRKVSLQDSTERRRRAVTPL